MHFYDFPTSTEILKNKSWWFTEFLVKCIKAQGAVCNNSFLNKKRTFIYQATPFDGPFENNRENTIDIAKYSKSSP